MDAKMSELDWASIYKAKVGHLNGHERRQGVAKTLLGRVSVVNM